jgi:hypothetical protein
MNAPSVLHLVHNLDIGGAQRAILDLATGLRGQSSWRPVVCAWRRGGRLEDAFARAGVSTAVLSLPRRSLWLGPVAV